MPAYGYATTSGWATVTAHRTPDPHAYNCKDPVEVHFDFKPDDSAATDRYRFPEVVDTDQILTVGGGANPSLPWVEEMGLVPGSQHRCERLELEAGVGPPVLYQFPDIETNNAPCGPAEGGGG